MTISVTKPGPAIRNDLPDWRPYVYRGTGKDELTAFMDAELPPGHHIIKVHLDRGGNRSRCRSGTQVTTDVAKVTCGNCRKQVTAEAGRRAAA